MCKLKSWKGDSGGLGKGRAKDRVIGQMSSGANASMQQDKGEQQRSASATNRYAKKDVE